MVITDSVSNRLTVRYSSPLVFETARQYDSAVIQQSDSVSNCPTVRYSSLLVFKTA